MYLFSRTVSSTSRSGGLGTIDYSPVLSLPVLPNILAEWTSLIPLVSHLASYQQDHQIVGITSLATRIDVGLFPRLGVLNEHRRLLSGGPDFLDRVSTIDKVCLCVWDVNWGSTFPCANGSASQMITRYALRGLNPEGIDMPDCVPERAQNQEPGKPKTSAVRPSRSFSAQTPGPGALLTADLQMKKKHETIEKCQNGFQHHTVKSPFRRYQVLHVIEFGRQVGSKPTTWQYRMTQSLLSRKLYIISHLLLIGLVVVLCLCGTFGTAAVVLNGTITRIISRYIKIRRPPGFLGNNEKHDACMLLSSHKNASIWYLYIGDRGVVDSLLNKTMIIIPSNNSLSHWFRIAHFIQILAMTFVAAQKGWDGLALILLLVVERLLQWSQNESQMVRNWLEAESVSVKAKSFRFTGRTPMIGAIHKLSESTATAWMDEIISPSARREVWLKSLGKGSNEMAVPDQDFQQLSSFDQGWVELNSGLATEAVKVIKSELGHST